MKKILIATSALAFASSAFAADVSGYSLSAYAKDDNSSGLYNETEVYFSGNKTASNGLTYGATYTIGFSGTSNSSESIEEQATARLPELAIVTDVNGGAKTAAEAGVELKSYIIKNDYANINAFVSGSFGKVEMGHHNSASKALGTASIAAGASIAGSFTADATRTTVDNAITYTTPVVYGLQAGYTMIPGSDAAKSMAVKYTGTVAGLGYGVVFGSSTVERNFGTIVPFDTMATGFEVTKSGFSVSYSMAKTNAAQKNTVEDTAEDGSVLDAYLFPESESSRFGVGYTNNKWTVGASMATTDEVNSTQMYVGYDVATSLTVFSELRSTDDAKTMYVGTNITF